MPTEDRRQSWILDLVEHSQPYITESHTSATISNPRSQSTAFEFRGGLGKNLTAEGYVELE